MTILNQQAVAEKELLGTLKAIPLVNEAEAATLKEVASQQAQAATAARIHADATTNIAQKKGGEAAMHKANAAAIKDSEKQLRSYVSQAKQGAEGWLDRLLSLRKAVTVFTGAFFAMTAYGAMGAVQQFFTDATKNALELADAIAKLQITVRAAQRAIGLMAGTEEQWAQAVRNLRAEFQIFSLKEWNEAAAQGIQIGREYGLTFDQMQKVLRSAALVSLMSGKDLSETTQLVARAVREDLRGLNEYIGKIDEKVDLDKRAHDAYGQRYEDLTKEQQQEVRLAEVYERATRAAKDMNVVLETQSGVAKTITADTVDLSARVGTAWTGAANLVKMAWVGLLTLLALVPPMIAPIYNNILKFSAGAFQMVLMVLGQIRVFRGQITQDALFAETEAARLEMIKKFSITPEGPGLPNVPPGEQGTPPVEPPTGLPTPEALQELYDELDKIRKDEAKKEQDLLEQKNKDLQQMELDHLSKLGEIDQQARDDKLAAIKEATDAEVKARDQARKEIEDAERSYVEERQKLLDDFNKDEARRDEDHAADLAKDEEDRQEKEAEELQKHYDKLKDIQEKYYFRILDAVRERDARAVLLAIRDRNKELKDAQEQFLKDAEARKRDEEKKKKEKEDNYARDKARRLQDFNERLIELKIQHEKEKDAIKAQLKAALEEIAKAKEARLKEIDDEHDKALKAEATAYNVAKMRRELQYNQDLIALRRAMDEQIDTYARSWAAKYKVTETYLNQIYHLMSTYFGPDGMILTMYRAMLDEINQIQPDLDITNQPDNPPAGEELRLQAEAAWRKVDVGAYHQQLVAAGIWAQAKAQFLAAFIASHGAQTWGEGGTFMTNGPELHMFGEGRDPHELVMAIPSSKLGSMAPPNLFGQPTRLEVSVTADEHFAIGVEDRIFTAIAEVVQDITPVKGGQRGLRR